MNESYECLRSSVPLCLHPTSGEGTHPTAPGGPAGRGAGGAQGEEEASAGRGGGGQAEREEHLRWGGEPGAEPTGEGRQRERERGEGGKEKGWSGLGQQRARRGCFERGKRE